MHCYVKKRAIQEATKSGFIHYRLKDYGKMVPGELQVNFSDLENIEKARVELFFFLEDTKHTCEVRIPKQHIFVRHRTINGLIPLSLWLEAEYFSNMRRIARREEAVYEEEWKSCPSGKFKIPKYHVGPGVLELCYDKGIYQCEFCKRNDVSLTLDHVIPKGWKYTHISAIRSQMKDIKVNSRANWQVLCESCNQSKGRHEQMLAKRVSRGEDLDLISSILDYNTSHLSIGK
jgi:5-methylcytosine-specific restriction endonuclease McrA